VYRAVGYKFGRWHDVLWLERALAAHDADPAPPMPLPALRGTPALDALLAAGLPVLRVRSGDER
jgi:phosphinothricin acetyltransferase